MSLAAAAVLAAGLAGQAGFTDGEWSSIESGDVVARVLDSDDPSEVVSIAGMTVRATRERFLECVRDPVCLKSEAGLTQSGRIAAEPSAAEFQGLTLDDKEVEQLADCRVGRCLLRLGEDDIARFQAEVQWASPAHREQATRLFREILAAHAAACARRGNAALPVYRDKAVPASVGERLAALLARPSWIIDASPDLRAMLTGAPRGTGERFQFWSSERFWRKPLVAVNEVSIAGNDGAGQRSTFVATKQLYASHYHDAALELLAFATDEKSGRSYVLFFGRIRADVRPSGFGWIERKLVRRLVRRRLEDRFAAMRNRLRGASGLATR
jgi:hypothetical protein